MNTLDDILDKIEALEKELAQELEKKEQRFLYTVREKRVRFNEEVKQRHRKLAATWSDYAYESGIMRMLTIPVIYFALVPAVFMDAVVSIFQLICFPVYGIPMVKRSTYIVMDHHQLRYLNLIEKLGCAYCSYFNGLIGFIREVAARTEQYWCPIRHARPVQAPHSRYRHFFTYGDAEGYRNGLAEVRKRFDDIRERENKKQDGPDGLSGIPTPEAADARPGRNPGPGADG